MSTDDDPMADFAARADAGAAAAMADIVAVVAPLPVDHAAHARLRVLTVLALHGGLRNRNARVFIAELAAALAEQGGAAAWSDVPGVPLASLQPVVPAPRSSAGRRSRATRSSSNEP